MPTLLRWGLHFWPGPSYAAYLEEYFAIGLMMAQGSLIAAWFVYASCTLLERTCGLLLMPLALGLGWFPEIVWDVDNYAAPIGMALLAFVFPARGLWLLAKVATLVVAGAWFSCAFPQPPLIDAGSAIHVSVVAAYIALLLITPLWLLHRQGGWNMAAGTGVESNLTRRTFSIGQIMGWIALVAVLMNTATSTFRSEAELPFYILNSLGDMLIDLTLPLIWLSASSALLLRATLAQPPWKWMTRVASMVVIVVASFASLPVLSIGQMEFSHPLEASVYVFFLTATLVAIRAMGFQMPRRRSADA